MQLVRVLLTTIPLTFAVQATQGVFGNSPSLSRLTVPDAWRVCHIGSRSDSNSLKNGSQKPQFPSSLAVQQARAREAVTTLLSLVDSNGQGGARLRLHYSTLS